MIDFLFCIPIPICCPFKSAKKSSKKKLKESTATYYEDENRILFEKGDAKRVGEFWAKNEYIYYWVDCSSKSTEKSIQSRYDFHFSLNPEREIIAKNWPIRNIMLTVDRHFDFMERTSAHFHGQHFFKKRNKGHLHEVVLQIHFKSIEDANTFSNDSDLITHGDQGYYIGYKFKDMKHKKEQEKMNNIIKRIDNITDDNVTNIMTYALYHKFKEINHDKKMKFSSP